VIALVVKEGVVLAAVGLGFGLIGAYFAGRAMQSILFGVSAIDLSAFGWVGLLLMLAALSASYLPALSAASVGTMQFLRSE
jgi:putative ABC transport system permease protein